MSFLNCYLRITYFNPRTPCGVRPPASEFPQTPDYYFNPRTPCGVRQALFRFGIKPDTISIHAPLAGCDQTAPRERTRLPIFQSTHPLRGATRCTDTVGAGKTDFNPRTPCGVRRVSPLWLLDDENISIHAPLAGCDRGVTVQPLKDIDFNPRTPCGVRPFASPTSVVLARFQSTHPLRGATRRGSASRTPTQPFQSTHPLRGATR